MKVSVIVPIYNVENYLEKCLSSIENQTLKGLEVILVNDGSKDGSARICQKFIERNNHFKYFEKENGGLMSAWLFGVEQSTGEYIGFVDSDDYIVPEMYEKLLNKAVQTGADIVMCGRRDITLDGQKDALDTWESYYNEETIRDIHDKVFPSLRGGNVSSARWNKLFKREVFISNLKYCACKSRYCEDRFIVPACLLTAKTFAYIPEPLYVYRMRKSANSKTGSPNLPGALKLLVETQTQMLKDKGLFERYERALEVARLNYLKLLIERNIFNVKDKKARKANAKLILSQENRGLVLSNKKDCANKFGKYLYWSFKLNSAVLLLLGAKIFSSSHKKLKKEWFD